MKLPNPRRSQVSWAEVEVPSAIAPSRVEISYAALEVPDPSRYALLSWGELETPDVPVNIDRSAALSWGELEVPTAPRIALIAWAEMETGTPPRSVRVAWAALEVPSVGAPPLPTVRRGTITLMGVGA